MKIPLLTLLTLGLAGHLLVAQSSLEIPPPSAPFVKKPGENADWTVTARIPEAPKTEASESAEATPRGPDTRITQVHSTQTGKIKRDQITYVDRRTVEYWYVDTWFLTTNAQGKSEIYDRNVSLPPELASGAESLSPSTASGFPGVNWISIANYKSVVPLEKRQAYHYDNGTYEAWIDVESKLPLAYKADDIVYTFVFNPTPAVPLTLPPGHLEAYQKVMKLMDRRKRLAEDITRQRAAQ